MNLTKKVCIKIKKSLLKSERTPLTKIDLHILRTCTRIINLNDSKCLWHIEENKQYVENKKLNILIIITSNQIYFIHDNHKDFYPLTYKNYKLIVNCFQKKLSRERSLLEDKYLQNTTSFLDELEELISWKC